MTMAAMMLMLMKTMMMKHNTAKSMMKIMTIGLSWIIIQLKLYQVMI